MVHFEQSLHAAAARAGFAKQIADVKFEFATLERTWGDRVGYVFYGADAATNERAARYFEKWYAKYAGPGSYEAQRSIAFRGEYSFSKFSNGAGGWSEGKLAPYTGGSVTRVETREGYAVSTTYFPCSD